MEGGHKDATIDSSGIVLERLTFARHLYAGDVCNWHADIVECAKKEA